MTTRLLQALKIRAVKVIYWKPLQLPKKLPYLEKGFKKVAANYINKLQSLF